MISEQPDVVIIGSGIAGALLADKLASAGVNTLILEAGPEVSRQQSLSRQRSSWKRGPNSAFKRPQHALFPDKEDQELYL